MQVASLSWVYFVTKKRGKIRIILDTRDVNGFFKSPPSTHLPSAAAFAALETDGSQELSFGVGDIADCFYHLGVPPGLEEWFSLPGIRGRDAPWLKAEVGTIWRPVA